MAVQIFYFLLAAAERIHAVFFFPLASWFFFFYLSWVNSDSILFSFFTAVAMFFICSWQSSHRSYSGLRGCSLFSGRQSHKLSWAYGRLVAPLKQPSASFRSSREGTYRLVPSWRHRARAGRSDPICTLAGKQSCWWRNLRASRSCRPGEMTFR